MARLIFDTCCGCIELRTGCLIIGYLNLVFGIIGIIVVALVGLAVGVVASNPKDFDLQGFKVNNQQFNQQFNQDFNQAASATLTTMAIVVAVITIILLVLYFTFSIVLLVGVHQNKRGHVKAYLVFGIVFLVLNIINFFASFANTPINGADVGSKIFSILLSFYFLLVIRSFYHKMDDIRSGRQPAIYNAA